MVRVWFLTSEMDLNMVKYVFILSLGVAENYDFVFQQHTAAILACEVVRIQSDGQLKY